MFLLFSMLWEVADRCARNIRCRKSAIATPSPHVAPPDVPRCLAMTKLSRSSGRPVRVLIKSVIVRYSRTRASRRDCWLQHWPIVLLSIYHFRRCFAKLACHQCSCLPVFSVLCLRPFFLFFSNVAFLSIHCCLVFCVNHLDPLAQSNLATLAVGHLDHQSPPPSWLLPLFHPMQDETLIGLHSTAVSDPLRSKDFVFNIYSAPTSL